MGRRQRLFWLAGILTVSYAAWSGESELDSLRVKLARLPEVKKAASPAEARIAPQLRQVLEGARQAGAAAKLSKLSNRLVRVNDAGEAQVYVQVEKLGGAALEALRARGLRVEVTNTKHKLVQGWLPLAAIGSVAAAPGTEEVRPASYGRLREGTVMTQGDAILRGNLVRARGVDGRGVKVGVISDGVTNRAVSQTMRDLPPTIQMDPTYPGNGDAGTALLEIVHDLAPAASLAFSGPVTSLEFIQAVEWLAGTARCNVIMDDVGFYGEPSFEDGPVAQAVAGIASRGVVYVSACGNDGPHHYQARYVDWNPSAGGWPNDAHAFAPFDADMFVNIPAAKEIAVFLQWSEPFGTAASDYDLYLYDDGMANVLAASNAVQNGHGNPYEAITYYNSRDVPIRGRVIVNRASGVARTLELFTWDTSQQEYILSADSVFGHPAATGVLSVGAINSTDPGNDTIAPYSSLGPTTIATPTAATRQTPRVVAIDGVSVTGAGGYPRTCYGTSVAAAHAAGVAALVWSSNRTLTAGQVISRIESTAVDLGVPGYDAVFGCGRVDAFRATFSNGSTGARFWGLLP